jgi:hypothetical protein
MKFFGRFGVFFVIKFSSRSEGERKNFFCMRIKSFKQVKKQGQQSIFKIKNVDASIVNSKDLISQSFTNFS